MILSLNCLSSTFFMDEFVMTYKYGEIIYESRLSMLFYFLESCGFYIDSLAKCASN